MRFAGLALLPLLAACSSGSWLLDRDALARATAQDGEATALLGSDAEPMLSVKPGDRGYLDEGPPGDRQIHVYSHLRDTTTVIAATPLHRDLQIIVIDTYPGPPAKGTR